MVDRRTGGILWTIGGKHSSFPIPASAAFQWQHDVEYHAGNVISLFDDHCCEITGNGIYLSPTGNSRGLVLRVDPATRAVSVLKRIYNDQGYDAEYMGNVELLRGGGTFIGWGDAPLMSDYGASGHLVFQAQLPGPDIDYRAYLQRWVGLPLTAPSGAARVHDGRTVVYASWNGATQVRGWRVLAVPASGAAHPVANAPRSGFETDIPITNGAGRYEVQAIDAAGRVIGTSGPFSPTTR
jgi:hypothetical protein